MPTRTHIARATRKSREVEKIRAAHQSNLLMDGVCAIRMAHGSVLRTIAIEKDPKAIEASLMRAIDELRLAERLVVAVERQLEEQGDPACLSATA